jgi:hypothetical protein
LPRTRTRLRNHICLRITVVAAWFKHSPEGRPVIVSPSGPDEETSKSETWPGSLGCDLRAPVPPFVNRETQNSTFRRQLTTWERQAVVSREKKQRAAARQGKPLANDIGFSSNCRELCRTASQQTRRPEICADWDSVSPLTFGGNGGANRQGADSFIEPTELESKGSRTGAAPMQQRGRVLLNCFTGRGLEDGFFHVRISMARPRVSVLSLNCLGHVEKKRKLRPTVHNPCTRETGLNGFVPASFLLGEKPPTSRDRSVPILDAEQGSMVRHTKGTRSQLEPPLLSTPPFAPASCPGASGTWEPKGRETVPTFRVLELELCSALSQLRRALLQPHHTNLNPTFSRCCKGSQARATLTHSHSGLRCESFALT